VIFMATLPLTQRGMDINLPLDTKAVSTPTDLTQVVLTASADGVLTLNRQVVTPAELVERLQNVFASRKDKTIFIEGSAALKYGDVVPLIDACSGMGLRVGIITDEMTSSARRPR